MKTLLTHKDLLNPKARILARKIIDKVVQRAEEAARGPRRAGDHRRAAQRPALAAQGLPQPRPRSARCAATCTTGTTSGSSCWSTGFYYFAAERNKRPWHVIVCVDQSGSMLDSAIFSAVMASIFAELPGVKTSLVLFDTEVVDLTDQVGSPVDVLLKVQLGGGTDITKALQYCAASWCASRRAPSWC